MGKELNYKHYLKNLKLIERNKEWLADTGVSGSEKMAYYGRIAASLARGNKRIKYLGADLYYDNPATPLNLQNYPYEISKKILANMHKKPRSVLDIGGNLGQFSLTINHVLQNKAEIDVFEPNSYIFEFLKKNTNEYNNIRIFNYGLGDNNTTETLYFNPTRTGIGSVLKKNAGEGKLLKQEINITKQPEKLTKRTKYDLVKIDVEGYEMHALKGLKAISFDYLFIELSGQGRNKDYYHSAMLKSIHDMFSSFDIYYMNSANKHSATIDMLVRVGKPKTK